MTSGRGPWGLATQQLSCHQRRLRGSHSSRRQSTVSLEPVGGCAGQTGQGAEGTPSGPCPCLGASPPRSPPSVSLVLAAISLTRSHHPHLPLTHLFVSPQICPPVAVGPRALPAITSEAGGGGCQALDWTPWDSGPSFSEPLETGPGSRDSILGSEDVLVPFLSSFLSLWLGLVRSPLLLPALVAPTQPLPRAPPGCPAC